MAIHSAIFVGANLVPGDRLREVVLSASGWPGKDGIHAEIIEDEAAFLLFEAFLLIAGYTLPVSREAHDLVRFANTLGGAA